MIGAPWMLAFALRQDGWYLRSDIIWARPNPMPESVTDRPTKAHSYLFLLTKSARYFYDADAIREAAIDTTGGLRFGAGRASAMGRAPTGNERPGHESPRPTIRNARTVWTIPTQPLPYQHYAAFPQELARRCILAGTSERGVCPECGAPWRRVVERAINRGKSWHDHSDDLVKGQREDDNEYKGSNFYANYTAPTTTGWEPTCDCRADSRLMAQTGKELVPVPVPAIVLDPFAGSGTTLLEARNQGRHSIGIELNPDYCAIAADRLKQLSLLAEASA
jgi:hypothetical protein